MFDKLSRIGGNMERLKDKVCIITGDNSGFGKEMTKLFASDKSAYITGQSILIDGGRSCM